MDGSEMTVPLTHLAVAPNEQAQSLCGSSGGHAAKGRSRSPRRDSVGKPQPQPVKANLTLGEWAWLPKDLDAAPGCTHWQVPLRNAIKTARMKLPVKVQPIRIESLRAGMAGELMDCTASANMLC